MAAEKKVIETTVSVFSTNRTTGTSSSQFTVKIPTPLTGVTKVKLNKATIPKTMYTIRAGINDTFDIDYPAPSTILISPGFYTATGLCAALQTYLQGVDANYTCTYSTLTGKVTVTNTSAFRILVTGGVGSATSACGILGFTTGSPASTAATSWVANNIINLIDPQSVFIVVQELRGKSTISSGYNGYTWEIGMAGAISGSIVDWTTNGEYPAVVDIYPATITVLTVSLVDLNGTLIDLNGMDWSFQFQAISET